MGIACGHVYVFLAKIFPAMYGRTVIWTPNFLCVDASDPIYILFSAQAPCQFAPGCNLAGPQHVPSYTSTAARHSSSMRITHPYIHAHNTYIDAYMYTMHIYVHTHNHTCKHAGVVCIYARARTHVYMRAYLYTDHPASRPPSVLRSSRRFAGTLFMERRRREPRLIDGPHGRAHTSGVPETV
eukprot:SAG11_NODE_13247_length_663_cov_1.039007_2_plen_183_part_00